MSAKDLTYNAAQFTTTLLATLCNMLGGKHLTTTAYHLETKKQVEQYNGPLVTRLQHCVSKSQKDSDTYVQTVMSVCRTQVHKFTNTTSFRLVVSWSLPRPTTFSQPSVLNPDSRVNADSKWLKLKLQRKINMLQADADSQMKKRGTQLRQHYNAKFHIER